MSLLTRCQFFYGHSVTQENSSLDFSEGGPEIQATLNIGDYTMEGYMSEVARAMTVAGTQVYSVSVSRTTRLPTVSAAAAFQLLPASGTRIGTGVWALWGFSASDRTGSNSYTGDLGSGFAFRPQALVENHVDKEDYNTRANAVVQTSAAGVVQSSSWGDWEFHQMEFVLVTNNTARYTNPVIETNAAGKDEFIQFMKYAIKKNKMEYMPDRATPAVFDDVLLEKSPASSQGTAFVNKEYNYAPGLFRSGVMLFRVVEI